jgi:regulator-associated protein of mTOR
VAGFGDGKVRVFDQRQRPVSAMVQMYSTHKQWITNVHMQRGGMRELVSGSRGGEIKLWDIRMKGEIRTIQATKSTLRTLSVHEHAPVFATHVLSPKHDSQLADCNSSGSDAHHVNFFNVNGAFLNSIEPSSGFLHSRSNPIAATAFHPHHMMLACSTLNDHHINIFACQDRRKEAQESY